jgi:hypothetical protein
MVEASEGQFLRVDDPRDLPAPDALDLVLVDWSYRRPTWPADLTGRLIDASATQPRLILFGPHTDLAAHAEARAAGLGPMWARSRLLATLPKMLAASHSSP